MAKSHPDRPDSSASENMSTPELGSEFVVEDGVLKLRKAGLNIIFQQARALHPADEAQKTEVTNALAQICNATELQKRMAEKEQFHAEIRRKLGELPDNLTLEQCKAHIASARSVMNAGDLRLTQGLAPNLVAIQLNDANTVYRAAESLVIQAFLNQQQNPPGSGVVGVAQPEGVQSYDLSPDFVMDTAGVLKIRKQVVEDCIQEARRTHPAKPADMQAIVDQLTPADIASLPNPAALNSAVAAVEHRVMQELAELDDHISLEQCVTYLARVKAVVTTGEELGKLPRVVAQYEAQNLDNIYSTAERLVRERFASCRAPVEAPSRVQVNYVMEGDVLKMTRQSFEMLIDQARALNPPDSGRLARISFAFDQHFEKRELERRKAERDLYAAEIVKRLKALPDNVSLAECLAYIQTARATAIAGDRKAAAGLPDDIAGLIQSENEAIYSTAERLVRTEFRSYGVVEAETAGGPPAELRFAGTFQAGELGPTGPGGLPERLVLPAGTSGDNAAIDALNAAVEQQAPTTIRRKELMTLLIDAVAPIEDDGLGNFAELCEQHLDDDGKAWFAAITEEISESSMKLYASESPDTQMTLEDCMAFIDKREAICIPTDALADLPDEVTSVYIARQRQVVEMERNAVRAYFAPKATPGFAPGIGVQPVHVKGVSFNGPSAGDRVVDLGTVDIGSATAEFTPEGGRVVATTGPISIEAPPQTITRKQFLQISQARKVPTELLHRIFGAIDGSGKSRMTRARFERACQGVTDRISADLQKISDHLSLDDCLRLIHKYEKWGANAKRKYLACCNAPLRRESEIYDKETFDQMRRTVKAMFKVAERADEPAAESGEATVSSDVITGFFRELRKQLASEGPAEDKAQQLVDALPGDENAVVMAAIKARGDAIDQILSNLPDQITLSECMDRLRLVRAVESTGALQDPKYAEIREALEADSTATYDQLEREIRKAFGIESSEVSSDQLGTISGKDLINLYGEALSMYLPVQSDVDEVKQAIWQQPGDVRGPYERACTAMQEGVKRLFPTFPEQVTEEHIVQVAGAFRMGQARINEANQFFPEELGTRLRMCTDNTIAGFECRARAALIHAGICRDAKNMSADEPTIESDEISQILGHCLNAPMAIPETPSRQNREYMERIVEERKKQVLALYAGLPKRLNLELCLRAQAMFQTIEPVEVYSIAGADQAQVLRLERNNRYANATQAIRQRFAPPEEPEKTIPKEEFKDLTKGARAEGLAPDDKAQAFAILREKVLGFDAVCNASNQALADGYDALTDPVTRAQCYAFLKLLVTASRPLLDNIHHLPPELGERVRKVTEDNKAAVQKAVDDYFAPSAPAEDGRITSMPNLVFADIMIRAAKECSGTNDKLLADLMKELGGPSKMTGISEEVVRLSEKEAQYFANVGDHLTEDECNRALDWLISFKDRQANTVYKAASGQWKGRWRQYVREIVREGRAMVKNWFAGPGGASESPEIPEGSGPSCILKSELIAIWGQEYNPPTGNLLSAEDLKRPHVKECTEALKATRATQLQITEDLPPFVTVARFEKFLQEMRGACTALEASARKVNLPAINNLVGYYKTQLDSFEQRIRTRFGMAVENEGLAVGSAAAGKGVPDDLQSAEVAEIDPKVSINIARFNSLFDDCVPTSREKVPMPAHCNLPERSRAELDAYLRDFKRFFTECVSAFGTTWLNFAQCKQLVAQLRKRAQEETAVKTLRSFPRKVAETIDRRNAFLVDEIERRLPELFTGSQESDESAEAKSEFRTSKIVLLQVMKQVEANCFSSHKARAQRTLFQAADGPVQKQIAVASKKAMQAVQTARHQLPRLITLEECTEYITRHRDSMRLTKFVEGPPLPDDLASSSNDMETEMLDRILEKLPAIFEQERKDAQGEPEGTVSMAQFVELLGEVDSSQNKLEAQALGTAYDKLGPALQAEAQQVSRGKVAAIKQFRTRLLGDRLTFAECKHYCRYSAFGFPPEDFSSKLPGPYNKVLRRVDRALYGEIEKRLPAFFAKAAVVERAEKEPQGQIRRQVVHDMLNQLATEVQQVRPLKQKLRGRNEALVIKFGELQQQRANAIINETGKGGDWISWSDFREIIKGLRSMCKEEPALAAHALRKVPEEARRHIDGDFRWILGEADKRISALFTVDEGVAEGVAQAVGLPETSLLSDQEVDALTKPSTMTKKEFRDDVLIHLTGMLDAVMPAPRRSDWTPEESALYGQRNIKAIETIMADYPDDLTEEQCTEIITRMHTASMEILRDMTDDET